MYKFLPGHGSDAGGKSVRSRFDPRWPVHQGHFRAPAGPGSAALGRRQSLQRRGIARRHRPCRFGFDQAHATAAGGHNEIHFQTLLIPEVVKLSAPASVQLRLGHFAGNKALEDHAQKRRLLQLSGGFDTEQAASQAGIGDIAG